MSNNYFQFKQFRIEQDQCAMKVSTDACIQGAWTPIKDYVKQVLDIGAGTGLLSLMLAQRDPDIIVDAIELDEKAAMQAKENIERSLWHDRIKTINTDVRNHAFNKRYDLIISNPPFFQNSLLGNTSERNTARHNLTLGYADLLSVFEKYIAPNGYISVMLPVPGQEQLEAVLIKNGWNVIQRLFIYPRKNNAPIRIVSLYGKMPVKKKQDEKLIVRENDTDYTKEFIALLQPFYLNL